MQVQARKKVQHKKTLWERFKLSLSCDWQLWVLMIPALTFFVVFCYFPMYGVQIAFRDYKAAFGITGSKWVGLKHFETFFKAYYCKRMFISTILLNVYGLLFGFPIPILLAIMLNQINGKRFKSFAQTVIYVPHFISTVVLAGEVIWWPKDFSLIGYEAVSEYNDLWTSYLNSIVYTLVGSLISVMITLACACALSRKFSGKPLVNLVYVWNLMAAGTYIQSSIPNELYEAAVLSVYYGVSRWTNIHVDFQIVKDAGKNEIIDIPENNGLYAFVPVVMGQFFIPGEYCTGIDQMAPTAWSAMFRHISSFWR